VLRGMELGASVSAAPKAAAPLKPTSSWRRSRASPSFRSSQGCGPIEARCRNVERPTRTCFRSSQGCGPIEASHRAPYRVETSHFRSSQGCGPIEAKEMNFICVVGESPWAIHDSTSIPTTAPTATLSEVIAFFQPYALSSLGLATFGLIALDRELSTYGHIISRGNVLSVTNG
jgi:hypothetical protein